VEQEKPDWVVVQGDTSTVWAAAVAAFFSGIKVAHVEAGLRTNDKRRPFPEEVNRRIVAQVADLHFAPTDWARRNLLHEGIQEGSIRVTGNTVIDALHWVLELIRRRPPPDAVTIREWTEKHIGTRQLVLITGHRRESFGEALRSICLAIVRLARAHPNVCWVYPVHLNPRVQEPVREILGGHDNVFLLAPQPYAAFVWLMNRSIFVITDSGGVQEEAPSLGRPVLVTRETTERPEGVQLGAVTLVGSDEDAIVAESTLALTRAGSGNSLNPYGDGRSAQRILRALSDHGRNGGT
jgi:UDP-N-acetylglucosamine 2-epimerase (non-hydrolysing)